MSYSLTTWILSNPTLSKPRCSFRIPYFSKQYSHSFHFTPETEIFFKRPPARDFIWKRSMMVPCPFSKPIACISTRDDERLVTMARTVNIQISLDNRSWRRRCSEIQKARSYKVLPLLAESLLMSPAGTKFPFYEKTCHIRRLHGIEPGQRCRPLSLQTTSAPAKYDSSYTWDPSKNYQVILSQLTE